MIDILHRFARSIRSHLDKIKVAPELGEQLAKSYRPVMILVLIGAMSFYGFITCFRMAHGAGPQTLSITLLSGSTFLLMALLLVTFKVRKTTDFRRLELVNGAVFAAIFVNIFVELTLFSDAFRLIYLCIFILGIAVGGVSFRVVVPGIIVAAVVGVSILVETSLDIFVEYTTTFVASVAAGITVAALIRAVVHGEVRARLEAERLGQIARLEADRDALTSLANRRAFLRALDEELPDPGTRGLTLFSIDVDGFKAINDIYGHPAGDAALVEMARRISGVFSDHQATVARLGGDEFAVAARVEPDQLEALIERLLERLRLPIELSGRSAKFSASVGIARHPKFGKSPMDAFECADYALIEAKKSGKDCCVVFSEATFRRMSRAVDVEHALQNSDLEAELSLVFQPQFDVAQSRIVGFEALARWNNELLGPVMPDEFICCAERVGMIRKLTAILLRKALAHAATWPGDLRLSFNLSSADIVSEEGVTAVIQAVLASGFPPQRLTLEITETAFVEEFQRAVMSIYRLSELGIKISMDDFGSGQSSFGRLGELHLDEIKMDRHFVSQVTHNFKTQKIVESVLKLCRTLGIGCVIEGVETAHQMDVLTDIGGVVFQGFYTGRPVPASAVHAMLGSTIGRRAVSPW